MSKYEFNEEKMKELTNSSEPTSAIATVVYEIENAKYNKLDNEK